MYNSLKRDYGAYAALLEQIIEDMPLPISVVDRFDCFTMINRAYEFTFDLRRESLLGRHVSCRLREGDESIHLSVQRSRSRATVIRLSGEEQQLVQMEGYPVFSRGELICSVAVFHELSSVERSMAALNEARRASHGDAQQKAVYSFRDILHTSRIMQHTIRRAKRAAATDVNILLRGESGTGKELFAHAIHNASERSHAPFISVNCASLPENLLPGILFGYEGHAFDGAGREGEIGLFEAANNGTLFLDEIGDISAPLQQSLLRVLQEGEITRVGDTRSRSVNVRLIAATNADLESRMAAGTFRADLYYRLNAYPVEIPPLRRRGEDVRLLAEEFLRHYADKYHRDITAISASGMEYLMSCRWDGNVRELQNMIARSVLEAPAGTAVLGEGELALMDVPPASGPKEEAELAMDYAAHFARWESALLREVYEQSGRNKSAAARRLGISVRSVYQKLKTYGIE